VACRGTNGVTGFSRNGSLAPLGCRCEETHVKRCTYLGLEAKNTARLQGCGAMDP
jgi:hypothetical protein